jgi:hypothetical protein
MQQDDTTMGNGNGQLTTFMSNIAAKSALVPDENLHLSVRLHFMSYGGVPDRSLERSIVGIVR